MKFAAIDIGSNAIRLIFMTVYETIDGPVYKKSSFMRLPIRLGDDVFKHGKISSEKRKKLLSALKGFKYLIDSGDVNQYRACATSAMRDAKNGQEIIKEIKKDCNLEIEIISGKEEAEIIFSNRFVDLLDAEKEYLYVDVGGGSTEMIVFSGDHIQELASFNIGTVRILNDAVKNDEWKRMISWLKATVEECHIDMVIGSGGNITKLFKLSKAKREIIRLISENQLQEIRDELAQYSAKRRVEIFRLNTDRADVIVPAADIFLKVLKATDTSKIFVPKVGLVDGIVRKMYRQHKMAQKNKEAKNA
ncbi:MAG: exopolyphosphatase [Flavobacteriales bacterium]|nr:exopolyphosphatase [Flavobacteriales bacterium]